MDKRFDVSNRRCRRRVAARCFFDSGFHGFLQVSFKNTEDYQPKQAAISLCTTAKTGPSESTSNEEHGQIRLHKEPALLVSQANRDSFMVDSFLFN